MSASKQKNDTSQQSIDIRVFITLITAAMAAAFGVGVALGPSPQIIPGDASASLSALSSTSSISLKDDDVVASPRSKTKHSSEIGSKIDLGDLNERHVNFQQPVLEDFGDGSGVRKFDAPTGASAPGTSPEDEEHLPAGQHLLVDLANVEAAFLNSETRLADAMVTSVLSAGLTMLSYHCHSLLPAGVSCVGVLLESHISFHTWPEEGVITLDLFTCGPNPLLPVVPDLERLFGIPRKKKDSDEMEEIISQWSHELRGFRNSNSESAKKNKYLDNKSDLAVHIISPLLFGNKKQIVSTNSPYQRIDVWDYLAHERTPTYQDALAANLTAGDPRWNTDEVVTPDRLLFLDGNLQSMKIGERELHETLVHPTMFAHPNPKHVAVIGGGEGATIREILKHETVESVTMIEVDEMLVDIAREHLAYMNDCSDIIGVADNCFDDAKTTLIYDNAHTWFKDRYGKTATKGKAVEKFDVIILDAFEPKEEQAMYKDVAFMDSIYAAMSDDGVFGIFVGAPFSIHDPKPDVGVYAPREHFLNLLEAHPSTEAMIIYEEAHSGYDEPQGFLTVCKSVECRSRWYETPVAIDDEISDRIKKTKSAEPALISYDGATHHSYQMTPKGWETVYCRREPTPFECAYRGLDLSMDLHEMGDDEEQGSFKINYETVDGEEVNTVFATVDIRKGSYIMPSDVAASMTLQETVIQGLKTNTEVKETGDVTVIEDFLEFVDEHGHESMLEGNRLTYVEVGATTFIRKSGKSSEVNVGRWVPKNPSGKMPVFSPVYERRIQSLDVFIVATRDIKAGEEIVKPLTM